MTRAIEIMPFKTRQPKGAPHQVHGILRGCYICDVTHVMMMSHM